MRLDLYNNKIGPQGSEHLGDMLAVNRTLIELDISQNSTFGPHVSTRSKIKFPKIRLNH